MISESETEPETESLTGAEPEMDVDTKSDADAGSESEDGWWPVTERLQFKVCELGGTLIEKDLYLVEETTASNLPAIISLCSPQIRALTLAGDCWSDRHLNKLQDWESLVHLKLSGCSKVTDEGLFYLSQLASLRALDLSAVTSTELTFAGFERLGHLNHLDLLRLPRTWPCPPAEDTRGERQNAALARIQAALPSVIVKRGHAE